MSEFISKWRFSLLLVALLGNILLAPLLGHIPSLIAFTLLLVIIVLVLGNNTKVIASYTFVAFVALLFTWKHMNDDYSGSYAAAAGYLFSFLALTLAITLIIRSIFSSYIVTIDTIASSLCAYLLLGFAFAYIYALIDITYPGSFISSVSGQVIPFIFNEDALDEIYFSFITLLTVGYGDIVPATHVAKLTTIIEGFCGQIYLVVLIARLVGMHVSQRSSR